MKVTTLFVSLSLLGSGISATLYAAPSTPKTIGLVVCTNPKVSCNRPFKTFAPYELGLHLPSAIKPNTDYKSVSFYAIVLKNLPAGSTQSCDGGEYSIAWEKERNRVQGWFSQRKVFADQQCPDMAAVSYINEGQNSTRPFIAVYGGATRKEAASVLAKMKRFYPDAKVTRMQVVFNQIVQ